MVLCQIRIQQDNNSKSFHNFLQKLDEEIFSVHYICVNNKRYIKF